MLAKLKYLVYILYVEYCAISAATSEVADKRVNRSCEVH